MTTRTATNLNELLRDQKTELYDLLVREAPVITLPTPTGCRTGHERGEDNG